MVEVGRLCLVPAAVLLTTTSDQRAYCMMTRSTNAQLRRAAGSQSLARLQEALVGWTVDELDHMAASDGKSAIHIAAWQGSLENLKHLLDMGCNVNSIATGEFSYGKTPIFFAATRCRNEVVNYLLDHGAFVKIVNNKGQSLLSIALSHLNESVVAKIQQKESEQTEEFWNFRETHSDGLEYGDLDPRFLDRPLCKSDIITPLVINPTTKESRKGSFFRRNPELQPVQTQKSKEKSKEKPILSPEEEATLERSWQRLGTALKSKLDTTYLLKEIVTLSDKRREAWIPEVAHRLRKLGVSANVVLDNLQSTPSMKLKGRQRSLIEKLAVTLSDPTNYRSKAKTPNLPSTHRRTSELASLSSGAWQEAYEAVADLSITDLESRSPVLSLPQASTWVDSIEALETFQNAVRRSRLVAIDTEWCTGPNGQSVVATIQVGIQYEAWVIDLLLPDDDYQQCCRAAIKATFQKPILGFALGHDVPKITEWIGESLPTDSCLDLQLCWNGHQIPGLAACAREFSDLPLSKTEQCSDWSARPLSKEQLEYAGLDAVVLQVILAEKKRSTRQDNDRA